MEIVALVIGAIFVNNVVLVQFLGICPFLGVSTKVSTAVGMSAAVTFVMTLATIVTSLVMNNILIPFEIQYLQTISYILIIASLVQMVELIMKKVSPPLYQALGVFLPLITTNCAILGVAILAYKQDLGVFEGIIYAVASSIGFAIALIAFAGIREKLELYDVPKAMKGAPLALVTAGLLALAFMGFSGMV